MPGCPARLRAGPNDHDDARWTAHFDEGSLAAETAQALHRLSDLGPAEQHARTVLVLRAGDRIRAQAFGRLTLAAILVDTGAHDEAADHGHHVAAAAAGLSSARVRARLGDLALTLEQTRRTVASRRFQDAVDTMNLGQPTGASTSWPV